MSPDMTLCEGYNEGGRRRGNRRKPETEVEERTSCSLGRGDLQDRRCWREFTSASLHHVSPVTDPAAVSDGMKWNE